MATKKPNFNHNGKRVYAYAGGGSLKIGDVVPLSYRIDPRGNGEYIARHTSEEVRENNVILSPDKMGTVVKLAGDYVWVDRHI